jgi:hypothetical protein
MVGLKDPFPMKNILKSFKIPKIFILTPLSGADPGFEIREA